MRATLRGMMAIVLATAHTGSTTSGDKTTSTPSDSIASESVDIGGASQIKAAVKRDIPKDGLFHTCAGDTFFELVTTPKEWPAAVDTCKKNGRISG